MNWDFDKIENKLLWFINQFAKNTNKSIVRIWDMSLNGGKYTAIDISESKTAKSREAHILYAQTLRSI